MCAFKMCQRDSSWWDNAKLGKFDDMMKKKEKYQTQRDFRSTHVEKEIFGGWTALHYACYFGHLNIVQALFPIEIGICTEADVKVPAPGISPSAKYVLASGSTPLSIALIGKQKEIVDWLLEELFENQKFQNDMVGREDANMLCTYQIASIVGGEIAETILKNEMFIEFECLTVETGDVTVPMNCAYFGKLNVAEIFAEIADNKKFEDDIYKLVLEKDTSGLTCVELALEPVDFEKMGTTETEKKEVAIILRKLVDRALAYGEDKGGKFKELIESFKENTVPTVEEIQAGLVSNEGGKPAEDEDDEYYSEDEEETEDDEKPVE